LYEVFLEFVNGGANNLSPQSYLSNS